MKKKPFSNAKKKEQIKARRARRREEGQGKAEEKKEEGEEDEDEDEEKKHSVVVVPPLAKREGGGKAAEGRGSAPIRQIFGLQTVFAREEDAVVEARKAAAHIPIPGGVRPRQEWERESLGPTHVLGMPVRPPWNEKTTKQQLERAEQDAFADWLKGVYARAATLDGQLNFFEHNLDVWRQLWRAIEMGDVLLVCADVRWPTFTFPYALMEYAASIGKPVVLTLTKTDLVPPEVAREWEAYFIRTFPEITVALIHAFAPIDNVSAADRVTKKSSQRAKALKKSPEAKAAMLEACKRALNWNGPSESKPFFTISAVGAPNAGKSAVINLLIEAHKVAVSATPGKTKHFQTHFVDKECRLLDSPGLMFPSVSPNARTLQAIVGNYPVSQLREPFSAVAFLATRVDLPHLYGLCFPYGDHDDSDAEIDDFAPNKGVDRGGDHCWSAFEICEALACKRGFQHKGGNYDVYRSGKLILAEALRGILKPLHWRAPYN